MIPVISLRDVVALSGRFPLLAGVTLDVQQCEIVHLRGANGAGKSSLLRMLSGLVPITAGSAMVLGHDLVVDRISVRRELALLGHASFLYDDLTVEDNVRFALRASRAEGARASRAEGARASRAEGARASRAEGAAGSLTGADGAQQALARLGLAGRLRTTRVSRLSAGQRRRAAIAVVVARRPRLWLLDEPHAGLDASGRLLVDELVLEARDAGATIVFASHELDNAERLADRTVEVSGGRVVEVANEAPGATPLVDGVVGEPAHEEDIGVDVA